MEPKLVLALFLLISATATSEYVRPPTRKTLNLSWRSKSSSHPQQVHISLAGDNHMRVSWVTNDKSAASMVEYGTSPGRYSNIALGESTWYSYLFYSSGMIHHTVIGPLEDNTVYYYRCGGGGPEYKLKTPPAQFPVTFSVAGDLGQTGWTKSTLDHIDQCKYDVHLLPGDLSYADYMQHLWDTFGELVEPLASAKPWMVTQGNHERELIPFFKDSFESYNSRWKMPFEESGSSSNLYYSFEVAGAHIIMLGSYTDYDEYSDQYNWLKERVNNGKLDPCGAVHITIGDGGNREGLAHKYKNPQPAWSVFREASFGHGELKLANSTHAFWSWHRNDDDEPVRSDQVWITSLVNSECAAEKKLGLRKILMEP
ncbi:hypothetical protein OIU77_008764 [Salix suchowensis]|uniref:Purple acid phosphatase n=1 Tax=Salix suchowensis TaxID=1278906 RepID=A0ABQ9ACA6_9ROSI|nr:hypothetical protein OIU77_008764 [Salix suchowensis]